MFQPDDDLFSHADRYPNHPGYRKAAPETSQDAAIAMAPRAPSLRALVKAALAAAPDGLTVHEAAEQLKRTVPAIQPRFSELVAYEEIEDAGKRRKNGSGRWAVVWKLK